MQNMKILFKLLKWIRMTSQNWVHAKPWHQQRASLQCLVPSRSQPSAKRLTRPERYALSSLPFYTAAGGGVTRVQGGRQRFCIARMKSVCVCVAEVREVPLACVLWAFSCFLLWSSFSSLHPTRSLRLRLLVCSTLTVGLKRDGGEGMWGGGWWLLPLTETLLVLSIQGEVQGELPIGHSHRVQGAVGGGFTRS